MLEIARKRIIFDMAILCNMMENIIEKGTGFSNII